MKSLHYIPRRRKQAGFSLVEVALATGILAFSFVAIIGVFPKGMETSKMSIVETRSSQLARTIFATMQSQAFTNCDCYGVTLDFSTLAAAAAPTKMYAEYPVQTAYAAPTPQPIKPTKGSDSIYTIEMRFNNTPNGLAAGTANMVTLNIYPQSNAAAGVKFSSIIANYQ